MLPLPTSEPIPLPARFVQIKQSLIFGREAAVVASWNRLLAKLRQEVEVVAKTGSDIIPTINFADINDRTRVAEFSTKLRKRGVAVIRKVVPAALAREWKNETRAYLSTNPHTKSFPTRDPHLYGVYWSPPQIKGRAHPNVLAAQKFVMSMWHSSNESALVSTNFPVTYADRLRIRTPSDVHYYLNGHVDGGSVERWEPDGYGRGGTYQKIWDGKWEEYDPWESSTRLGVTSDLYNGAGSCSMFRMFQGWLSMSAIDPGEGTFLLCPMIQLSTAYFLLRPFFSSKAATTGNGAGFLDPENWTLDPRQTSVLHGALPSYTQELNNALHPHLQLARSMVRIPAVEPGDYVVWHCDAVYGVDRARLPLWPGVSGSANEPAAAVMYIPACPLTQTNALYLARQRKAFLLGHPSPDFGGGHGESSHMGRPGVQEVSDAGGDDGLRAMGLLPWEEDEAESETERDLLAMANAILFPDRYDMI
jgi:hypothetical protein